MSELIIDCEKLPALPAPSCVEEFTPLRDEVRIFSGGITNKNALELNFETAKDLLPNEEIWLSYSLENDAVQIPCKLHDYLDYCLGIKEITAPCHNDETGETFKQTFTDEPIYLFQCNNSVCKVDEVCKSRFIECPSYMGDWFNLHMPMVKQAVVYGDLHTWVFLGPKGTKSEMHNDHDFVHTTIQQLDGRKRFFLTPPSDIIKIKCMMGDSFLSDIELELLDNGQCKVTTINGDLDLDIFKDIEMSYGDLNPHDVVYLPEGWGHYAQSLSPSFSISRDFVDDRNIDKYIMSGIFLGETFRQARAFVGEQRLSEILLNHGVLQEV